MSLIAFRSPQRTVSIHGPERANARILCSDFLVMALGVRHEMDYEGNRSPLRLLINTMYMKERNTGWFDTTRDFLRDFELYVRSDSHGTLVLPNGTGEMRCWHAALNTAIAAGSDPVRFLARVDAQCEMHGYVEGKHRAWLADIVEEGIQQNILRCAYDGSLYRDEEGDWWGWKRLVQMLRGNNEEPVVMSHSSGMGFPDLWALEKKLSSDDWYALSSEEQWALGMLALRQQDEEEGLEISPDNLATCYFEKNVSGYDIRAMLDEEIVALRQRAKA